MASSSSEAGPSRRSSEHPGPSTPSTSRHLSHSNAHDAHLEDPASKTSITDSLHTRIGTGSSVDTGPSLHSQPEGCALMDNDSQSTHHQPYQSRDRRTSPSGSRMKLPSAAERRRTRNLASALLKLCSCSECERPVNEPVTLPCGHTACLGCIKKRCLPPSTLQQHDSPMLPCRTHIPPRLPLSPMTVSCPVSGCPRSAIGRGMGKWSGHRPHYGLVPSYSEHLAPAEEDSGPGSPPLDGFVIGVADHPHRLTVVGPQCRYKAHLFAVPPVGVETTASGSSTGTNASLLPSLATSNLLRLDVTLSKAVAILKRYTNLPVLRSVRSQMSLSRTLLRTRGSRKSLDRRRNAAGLGRGLAFERGSASRVRGLSMAGPSNSAFVSVRGHDGRPRGASSRRSQLARTVMSVLGTNESDLESGTVGGVRAVSESEDEDEEEDLDEDDEDGDDDRNDLYADDNGQFSSEEYSTEDDSIDEDGLNARLRSGFVDDDEEDPSLLWPDGVGGAYSRPLASNSRSAMRVRRKRRRARTMLQSNETAELSAAALDSLRHGPTRRLHEDNNSRHPDSGWSTEDSSSALGVHPQDQVPAPDAPTFPATTSSRSDASGAEGKSSFALSTKTGPNGESLVQTVATLHWELMEVLECQLCYLLLYQPLTTPCGHTFCKSCFARSLDHGKRCPLCRAEMPNVAFFSEHPPNVSILKILTADTAYLTSEDEDSAGTGRARGSQPKMDEPLLRISGPRPSARASSATTDEATMSTPTPATEAPSASPRESHPHHLGFKRLYDERKSVIEQEEREARLSTPIFVCTLAFPQMPTILHIFEPRYRLMIRRCLESGSPRFGMVLPSRTNGGLGEYGTMLEIKSVQMLTDGRSMLETVGSYRFKLLEKGSLDGYTVGRVERVDDISLEEEDELERAAMLRRRMLDSVDRGRQADRAASSEPHSAPSSSQSGATAPQSGNDSTRPDPRGLVSDPEDAITSHRTSTHEEGEGEEPLSLYHRGGGETVVMRRTPSSVGFDADSETEADSHSDAGGPPFLPIPQEPSTAELVEICRSFITTLRSGSAPWLLSRLNNAYGPMPEAHEVERLGYWMALVMPIDEHEKAKLLPITSRRVRLCMVVDWIEQLRQSWWFSNGCTVS